jgi:hypothetical protein
VTTAAIGQAEGLLSQYRVTPENSGSLLQHQRPEKREKKKEKKKGEKKKKTALYGSGWRVTSRTRSRRVIRGRSSMSCPSFTGGRPPDTGSCISVSNSSGDRKGDIILLFKQQRRDSLNFIFYIAIYYTFDSFLNQS